MIWKTGTDGTLFLQPSIYKSLTDNLQGNSVPSVPLFPMKPSESPPSLASSLLMIFYGWVPIPSFQSPTPPASRKLEPMEPISSESFYGLMSGNFTDFSSIVEARIDRLDKEQDLLSQSLSVPIIYVRTKLRETVLICGKLIPLIDRDSCPP